MIRQQKSWQMKLHPVLKIAIKRKQRSKINLPLKSLKKILKKEHMDKQKAMTLAYWIMIVVVVITCLILVNYMISNSHQCIADPLKYYSERIGQECYCIKLFP